ncbi:MAG TPA: DUF4783 domain-containing protein [Saprospiraceae bacterium]|nr:DUF4783 domain-containing protein [Saprospiraceae bacterium]
MKQYIAILGLGTLFVAFSAFTPASDLDDIKNALKNGDAVALGKYLGDQVEIEIDGDVDYYNKEKAVARMKSFFASNTVSGFSQAHQGSTKDNSAQFLICHLNTKAGLYRVYLLMRVENNHFIIQEMNFSKE